MLFSIVLAIFTLLKVPVRTPIRIPIKIIEQSGEVSNQSEVGVWGVLEPLGIAVRDNGEIVVVERGKHCVSIFAPNGTKIRTFGTKGSGQGQFDYPDGVARDSAGNIMVVLSNVTSRGNLNCPSPLPLPPKMPENVKFSFRIWSR